MQLTFATRDGRTHHIRLALADYCLADLMGFRDFSVLFPLCFAGEGGPWLPVTWVHAWFQQLDSRLEAERKLLPYRYGAGGDFGGGETVRIGGEVWSLTVGPGECSLSQAVPYAQALAPGVTERGSRLAKWVDLRGQSEVAVDGEVIKLQRRKHAYRWYDELPHLLRFLAALPLEAEVRAVRNVD